MAIDTAAKRLSMLGFANALVSLALVDANVTDSDRYTWLTLYGGIALSTPEVVIGGGSARKMAMIASLRHRRN